jgi:hypothetical protein
MALKLPVVTSLLQINVDLVNPAIEFERHSICMGYEDGRPLVLADVKCFINWGGSLCRVPGPSILKWEGPDCRAAHP